MQRTQDANHLLFWHHSLSEKPTRLWFSPNYWREKNAIIGQSHGRGITYFIEHQGQQWVLRHYRRGGLIARLSDDHYLFTGVLRTRVWREFQLLKKMSELGLPVPRPIAGHIYRKGFSYQADILISKIPAATDLFHHLQQQPLLASQWQQIGALIARFHQAGIYHADLNIHNLLLDNQGEFYIIDFDRGEQRTPQQSWQQANLQRLLRSCRKEQQRVTQWHWQEADWQLLMDGYLATNPPR
jgi:3-deoxy-D-manno-octulosonic acid kinase